MGLDCSELSHLGQTWKEREGRASDGTGGGFLCSGFLERVWMQWV